MKATRVGIISMPTNGRLTRNVPRGASCVCEMLVYPGGLPLYLQKCKESADAGYTGFILS
jgi:hypothetical protein